MAVTFVDKQWHRVFNRAASRTNSEMLIITPFIKKLTIREILTRRKINGRLITRFSLRDFYDGVSDLDALEFLLDRGSEIKGIKNLHAKVYIFGPGKGDKFNFAI